MFERESRRALRIHVTGWIVVVSLGVAASAAAQATIEARWLEVNGQAILPASAISADPGDYLKLEIRIPVDVAGFAGASISLRHEYSGFTLDYAEECPVPPNVYSGRCNPSSAGFPLFSPIFDPVVPGVGSLPGGSAALVGSFDTITSDGTTMVSGLDVVIGHAYFVYWQPGGIEVGFFDPAADAFLDGDFIDISESISTPVAWVNTPEPSTAIGLSSGGLMIAFMARRRRGVATFPASTRSGPLP